MKSNKKKSEKEIEEKFIKFLNNIVSKGKYNLIDEEDKEMLGDNFDEYEIFEFDIQPNDLEFFPSNLLNNLMNDFMESEQYEYCGKIKKILKEREA